MRRFHLTRRDALRCAIAGTEASNARTAAQALFEAGGHRILPATLQRAVRGAVEHETSRLLLGVGLLESGTPAAAVQAGERAAARAVVSQTARAAGRQALRSMTAAAGAGALIDGGWALVQAAIGVRRGTMTRRQAVEHVAREASTGAAAAAAGTAAAVLLVTLTGGIAAPAVFVVGAATSLAAKAGLEALLSKRGNGTIRAELDTTTA